MALAEERLVVLTELLHRVRNDLQLVYSAACASARDAIGTEHAAGFDAIGHQVLSMAALYNHLLGAGMATTVDLGKYLETLCAIIGAAENLAARDICIHTELQNVPLGLRAAVVFGTVVNELIANAAKHAFEGGVTGVITVRLITGGVDGRRSGVLSLADDGRGLGAASKQSRGLNLSRKLLGQIGCDLTRIDQERGTAWRIDLP